MSNPRLLAILPLGDDAATFEASSHCGVFHVRRDGLAMPTQPFDNGADYFCSGLARYVLDGKYGFMNRALEVVVAARYDFAFPFRGELGPVCMGCERRVVGEYTSVSCERCGAVNATGQLVVPLSLSSQQFFAEHPGGECSD